MADQQQSKFGNQPVPAMPERVNIERIAKYDVFDAHDNNIGTTSAIWMDKHNQPAFIGVKTNWLLGKTHVIPAWGAEVNHATHRVRIACEGDVVKDAPTFPPDEEFDYDREREVLEYFQSKGACQPAEQTTARSAEPESNRTSGESTTIPLHEETVNVGKRTVEAGGVRLRKVVRTETVQKPVELKREEIQVERAPASAASESSGREVFQEQDIYIPLRQEEPVVEKQTQVREEVRARKTAGTEKQTVSGEVRKEDVEVERDDRRKAA
ncbi:MAG TPA: YsnF/AvaK domain-containing protein [Verrucomicrobiae bacterium]|nr:YsnF/AvaK domain-containing protein [Verrucomicrobiae bacterium]